MNARPQQIVTTLTVALAFAAVLIGSAQAAGRPDDRAGIRGVDSQNAKASDGVSRAVVRAHAAQAVRPDDRAGPRPAGTTTPTPIALPDVFERAVLLHNASTATRPDDRPGPRATGTEVADHSPITTTASAGFQWADAGFGAAAALVLVLVLAGLTVARANHHRSHPILD